MQSTLRRNVNRARSDCKSYFSFFFVVRLVVFRSFRGACTISLVIARHRRHRFINYLARTLYFVDNLSVPPTGLSLQSIAVSSKRATAITTLVNDQLFTHIAGFRLGVSGYDQVSTHLLSNLKI